MGTEMLRVQKWSYVGHYGRNIKMLAHHLENYVLRRTLMHTKNLYENGPNPFFSVFFNLMGTRMVQIRMAKSV